MSQQSTRQAYVLLVYLTLSERNLMPSLDTTALCISDLGLLDAPQTFQAHSYLKDFAFALFPPVSNMFIRQSQGSFPQIKHQGS